MSLVVWWVWPEILAGLSFGGLGSWPIDWPLVAVAKVLAEHPGASGTHILGQVIEVQSAAVELQVGRIQLQGIQLAHRRWRCVRRPQETSAARPRDPIVARLECGKFVRAISDDARSIRGGT